MNNTPEPASRDNSQLGLIDSHNRSRAASYTDLEDNATSRLMISLGSPASVLHNQSSQPSLRPPSETHEQHRPQPQASQPLKIQSEWIFEIIASVCSVVCFVILVAVLEVSRGKEPQFWLGGRITLNSLIALITTITRASIMVSVAASLSQLKWNRFAHRSAGSSERLLGEVGRFDKASRGPWGSLKFLVRPHM